MKYKQNLPKFVLRICTSIFLVIKKKNTSIILDYDRKRSQFLNKIEVTGYYFIINKDFSTTREDNLVFA